MNSGGMKFPVDLLVNVGQEELEQSAHNYMNNLLYSSPDSPEHLTVSDSTQVAINISSVGFIPLYGFSDKQKILALFSPSDPFIAVALYLLDQWWTVDNILKTADAARDGALEVKTVGERIVLYILNRVIYRAKEMSSEELPFLCHGEKDYAKILWSNGEAVGFYSVKPSGSLCNSFSTRTYQLPVMDSTYVRKCQRGKGFGLQMLEDFVLSFKEDCLGLRYPLTKSMYKVCEKYLCQHPGDIDLLWEVESIGAPNQRTNIASKIQAMDLGEESLAITEVTEKTAERETLTTQTKEAGSMECTVEIVEEVALLRAAKVSEAEDVALALRGRSGGSKRRNITEKPQENKSEKVCIKATVIRIEDIEPETPRQQRVSGHVSELEQTEGMFSVAAEEKAEDVVHTIPEDESVMLDKPATVPLSQDLKEADVIAALMTEVPQVEDDVIQVMKNDSQVIVENMASEIEEAEEERQKEDTEVLVSTKEPLEVNKKAETLDKVGEGTEIKISDEKSEEIITQHELSLSKHTTSEDVEAERTVKTVVEVIKLVQNETHRQSSQQHSKSQDTAQDRGRILRRRTVSNTPTPKREYTRHSQNICEELTKEVDEEENNGSTKVVEELAVTERKGQEEITSIKEDIVTVGDSPEDEKQQHEDEQLTHEEETKKEEGPERGDSVVKKSSTAQTALKNKEGKITDESEKEQKNEEVETSLIQDKQETSDDEIEESPVVLRRAVTGRHEVIPKPNSRKQSKSYQNQEEHTDQAGLRKGGSAEEKADEQAAEKQIEEHHKVFCESVVIEATFPTVEEAAEDVILSTEMNMEEICKKVQEEKETERETRIVSAADNEEEADSVAGSQTVISDEVRDEAGILGAEGPQDRNIGSEIPKLQRATVILVDFKTTYHHLSVIDAEEKTFDGKCAALEMEQMELIAAEEKQVSREPEMPMLEEGDQEKQENITENSVDATAEVETVQKEELEENNAEKEKYKSAGMDEKQSEAEEVPVLETRVLRSGRKTIDASCKARERSNQQQREDNIGEGTTEKEVAEADAGTVEAEGEMDAVTVIVPVEEKKSVSEICADTATDILVGNYAEEAPVVETRAPRSGTKTVTATPTHKTRRRRKQVDEQEAQNSKAQRRGRISISATPKGKSRSTQTNSKQIRKEQQKEEEESKSVEDTRVEEAEISKEAAVEQTNEEGEEEMEAKEVASEREESLELEMDVQELKVVAEEEQNVEENQSEVTSKTFAGREAEASNENYNDRKPVVGIEEVELPPAAVIRSLRSGGKTSKAPPKARRSRKQEDEEKEEGEVSAEKSTDGEEPPVKTRFLSRGAKSVSRSCKQLQEKRLELKESVEEAEVEEQEAVLGSDEEPPTDGDKRKAQEEDRVEVEKGGLVTAEEEASEKGTMSVTEEEENTAGVTAAAGDLVQGEIDPALAKPHNDSAVFTPSEEEAILSTEEQQSKEKTSLLSDLQSVTVVLVDLKKAHYDIQGETATVEESVLVEKTCDAEEEQKGGIMKEEETVAEGPVPGSPAEIEKTELEKVVLEEEGLEEEVEDVVTIQENTGEGCVEETEAKIVDDDEEELKVTEMRKLRSRKYAAKATSRHKSTSRQKQGKKEKKAASEISEDEPVTHVRALGGGGGSIPVAQRCRTRTQKQLQEEKKGEGEGREGSTGVEEREAEEEEEYIEEQHTTQEMEIVEYMGVEKADTMAEEAVSQDAPEEEQAGTTETVADENTEAPAKQTAEDRKTSYDVAQETVTTQYAVEEEQSITTSKGAETAAAEYAQNTLLITKHDEARGVSDQEEASVSETIILRGGEKAVRAKPRGKATKKQDDEQEVEAAGEKSTEEDEPAVDTRVLRKGKRSDPATPRNRSKRACTQCQPEEEAEGVTTPAEESEEEENKADENENNSDEKIEEMDDEEFVPQKESFTEQETPSTNKRNITEEEEAPVVEPRVLRSGHKSADTGKPAETRVQRRGRRTAPATPRLKSKRARTQCQPEQEAEEVTTPSEETEGEEEVAREESPEEKGERAEEGEKWKEMEVEKKDLEEVQVESAAGGDSVVDTFTEETTVLENEHNRVAAVNETNTDTIQISTAKVERTNSAEEEESAVIEKATAAREVGSDTTTAEEESLTEDAYAVTQEEAPVVARALRSKTKTPHATPSGGLKRQRDQGVVESQQQEDENPEDEKTQEEVHLLTDDIVECREINVKEQAEANETLSTGEEAKPLVEDTAEHQAKEKSDFIYNRGLEPKEMESPESSSGESKEDKTADPSVEGRSLRRRKKTTNKDGDKVEEIQLPKRRSIRKRPRMDYRENDEEEEGGETEAATDREEEEEVDEDEDEDNRKAECSANEQVEKLGEDNKNENLEKDMGAIESTSEKGDILNLVLDTDEKVETAALSQEREEDEQNISEEEVEPIVIDKRVLRGRSVPSVIITPHSKPRHHSAKVRKSEESLSDEEKSPQSAQKRSVHKRKSTEVPPTRKSKRHSRV